MSLSVPVCLSVSSLPLADTLHNYPVAVYVVAGDNMWRWATICAVRRQYVTMCDNMCRPATICDDVRQYVPSGDNMWRCATICAVRRQYVTMGDNMCRPAIICAVNVDIYRRRWQYKLSDNMCRNNSRGAVQKMSCMCRCRWAWVWRGPHDTEA